MTTIGFLACETTLPGVAERRDDAYEHDLMIASLTPAFTAKGLDLRVIDWEAPIEKFEGVQLAILGSSWNYQDKVSEFVTKLDAMAGHGITVWNKPEVVRWNASKTYLRELTDCGVRTIPTLWRETLTTKGVIEAMEIFDTDRIVVKRQIGAGALDQELFSRGSLPGFDWNFGHKAMLQPFLPAISKEGELSFIFIDGELSHALRKTPANGDYRIQSLYGGSEETYTPTPDEAYQAASVIGALPFETPLYARIDMLPGDDGLLMVMEAELIEPYLYPEQGPELGERLAHAIAKRVLER